MKQIFTLFTMGMLCLFVTKTNAQQVTESFANGVPTASCWQAVGLNQETVRISNANNVVITSQSAATAALTTPYIDIPANGTVKFDYNTTEQNATTLSLTISLIDIAGTKTLLGQRSVTGRSWVTYTSPSIANGGTYRVVIDFINTGNAGGNSYIRMDNLSISGSLNAKGCNLAPPDAVNDPNFTSASMTATISGNILSNDNGGAGETITVISVNQPSTGTVTWDAQGNFTFTPNSTFVGGATTFTYTITDDGYSPLTDVATVTLTYPAAPVAVADNYGGSFTLAPYSGDVITNDTKPTGTILSAVVVDKPATGSVVLNPDGTFTYTPAAGFTGGDVMFTYHVTYDAYAPLYSNTAVVTITYPFQTTTLPIKLVSFTGTYHQSNALLNWVVEDNETGDYFQVQKSADGKDFTNAAVLFVSNKKGKAEYSYKGLNNTDTYYRLQIVNKDRSITYSKVVLVKAQDYTAPTTISLLQNPVHGAIRFKFNAATAEETIISIYGMNGARLSVQKLAAQKGMNYVELDANMLSNGTYVLEVASKTEQRRIKVSK